VGDEQAIGEDERWISGRPGGRARRAAMSERGMFEGEDPAWEKAFLAALTGFSAQECDNSMLMKRCQKIADQTTDLLQLRVAIRVLEHQALVKKIQNTPIWHYGHSAPKEKIELLKVEGNTVYFSGGVRCDIADLECCGFEPAIQLPIGDDKAT
jgi:hypothetical protein